MAPEHIVKSFDDELKALQSIVAEMGALAGDELQTALDALAARDGERAATAASADEAVNRREHALEEMAVKMIAIRQPMADDLRTIIAGLRASRYLERVGDQAKNIGNRVFTLVKFPPVGVETAVLEMGAMVADLLRDALDAYVRHDVEKAEQVRVQDVDVDRRHTEIFGEILALNAADSSRATVCTHLCLVVRSIERIGDLATDVAEEVIFATSGRIPDDNRKKADDSFFVTQDDT